MLSKHAEAKFSFHKQCPFIIVLIL